MEKVSQKIKSVFSVIFTFAGIFFILAAAFIFPVYFLSENFPRAYNLIIICLIAAFLLYLTIRKLCYCYQKYKSFHKFAVHILVLWILPLLLTIALIILELLLIRTFFFIPIIISLLLECIFNAAAIVACVYLLSFFNSIKNKLNCCPPKDIQEK